MRVITAPQYLLNHNENEVSLFLAGSIEMGKAEEWQMMVIERLNETLFHNLVVYNPRRKEWDSTWAQSIDNPEFNQQVNWELDHLEKADHIIFYFAPNTMSPISLMELGKFSVRKNVYVVCSPEYLRPGNVQIFCYRYNIQLFPSLNEAILRFTQDYKRNHVSSNSPKRLL